MAATLLFLAGDGIGPEVLAAARRLADWFAAKRGFAFTAQEGLVGGAAYDAEGQPISPALLAQAKKADAILFGAVGGPRWDNAPYALRPEAALLSLRQELGLYANLRPALCFPALAGASSLKKPLVEGLDILIVRELTGGVYFGRPRGIETLPNGERRGVNTHVYESHEIRRIAQTAFELAAQRRGRVCSVEKRNVMEAGQLWYEEVGALHKSAYPAIALSHMLADNFAMQLVREPKQFDVILTDNLFGDILSDIAAQLTGSLGMLPSASLGAIGADGRPQSALYEPVHGSAPDIAGQNIANPLAAMLSFGMMLRYSFGRSEDADLLDQAAANVLAQGWRTKDIAQSEKGEKPASTDDMTAAMLAALDELTAR